MEITVITAFRMLFECFVCVLFNFAGNPYLLPGATVATILMLGALHARRLYEDKKVFSIASHSVSILFSSTVMLFCGFGR